MALCVKKNIFRLQIPVHNAQLVQIAKPQDDFCCIESGTLLQMREDGVGHQTNTPVPHRNATRCMQTEAGTSIVSAILSEGF